MNQTEYYNAQPEIKGVLNKLSGISTAQGMPEVITSVPLITYSETGTTDDNSLWIQETSWTFNIFTNTSTDRTRLKTDLYRFMLESGWRCTLSQGLNDPSKYERQIMIFTKTKSKLSGMTYSG